MTNPGFLDWRVSTRSGGGSNCVEVATSTEHTTVAVRDSKDRPGPILIFDAPAWTAFLDTIRATAFDRPGIA